ncbi:hypothetical protein SCLCIDRAFT_31981 [Scleroderma citrinum Foug A]|uniref:Uncharacterized protein n=1 Tax=Scleroderma citrinum Foug A TaxID=1036808 RepID=A0A0C3CXJ3_9AGAM|nr:hypothetical protein SCLCIDRAFT_31981 [Scleroderma citrinum Foug A]
MLNTCDLRDTPRPVVAFNDGGLGFYPTKRDGPPNCTYTLLSDSSYIQDVDGNVVLVENPHTPQEWVITAHEDKYTVVKKGTTLAWTDPGGQAGCERELHLTELNPIRPEVLFEFIPLFP